MKILKLVTCSVSGLVLFPGADHAGAILSDFPGIDSAKLVASNSDGTVTFEVIADQSIIDQIATTPGYQVQDK